jgi:hypothetical protein
VWRELPAEALAILADFSLLSSFFRSELYVFSSLICALGMLGTSFVLAAAIPATQRTYLQTPTGTAR